MPKLLLESLKIKNYRIFDDLTIEKLGRVNLIVGKNNVGKTTLLEGLWLYANAGYGPLMFDILRERNEIPPFQNGTTLVQPESSRGLRNMFYGRPNLDYLPNGGAAELEDQLEFRIGENIDISGTEAEQNLLFNTMWIKGRRSTSNDSDNVPSAHNKIHSQLVPNYFLKARGLTDKKLLEFWNNIERLVREDKVNNALRIIIQDLVDVRFGTYSDKLNDRVPVVRLKNATERIPLRSYGEGMTRILGITSALINCENGMFFVDEIESGLHYSILSELWKLIFRTAKDLNIQVFATTHSKDCVEAFAEAAEESPEDGMLIRLERQGERIIAKAIEEERLELAMDHGVEVR